MTQTALAAAVRAVVEDWIQTTLPARQLVEMANPATLSAVLGLAVQQQLLSIGVTSAEVRALVLEAPYCHLKGIFAADALVDTPLGFAPVPDIAGTLAGRAAALAVHGVVGLETVSYGAENDGSLFVNLVAMPGKGAFPEKSKKSMRGHTDAVSFPFNGDEYEDKRIAPSPDLVTLVGLRNPKAVPTTVMPLAAVLERLTADDVEELKKRQYSVRSQKTFVQGMKRILTRELVALEEPVLKDFANGTYVRYSHSTVVAAEPGGPAERASNNFEAACNECASALVIEPGDVLVVNNRLGLHGRGEVGDEVGGQSRWLLRTYALDTSNLPAHKRHLGAKPPHVLFP